MVSVIRPTLYKPYHIENVRTLICQLLIILTDKILHTIFLQRYYGFQDIVHWTKLLIGI